MNQGRLRRHVKTKLKGLGVERIEPKEVEFNERGQPIGDASVSLSTFLGALIRSTAPLDEDDWRNVDPHHKENLWTIVLQRYKLDEEVDKDDILKRMGKMLREHRSRLGTAVRKACALEEDQKEIKLGKIRPQNLTDKQWEDFIKKACSVKATNKSNLMKLIREQYKDHHTMSRRGYARLEAKLKKENPELEIDRVRLWTEGHLNKERKPANSSIENAMSKIQKFNEEHSGTQISSLKEDAVTSALGKDRPNMIKGLGFGVTGPKLKAQAHSTRATRALQMQVDKMQDVLEKLMEEKERSGVPERGDSPRVGSAESREASNNLATDVQEPIVGQKCKLMSWYKKGEIVAEGTIASTDPTAMLHFNYIGLDAWKVWVEVALDPNAMLWRATPDAKTIKEAIGSPIAWSKGFISLAE